MVETYHGRVFQRSIRVRKVVNWHCHTVLRGPFSDPCLLLVLGRAWIRSVSGCLPLKLVCWQLRYSKKEQLSKGPDHQTLVVMSLWHVNRSKGRWHLEYACAKTSCRVLHATLPKIRGSEKTFVALHKSMKFAKVFSLESFPVVVGMWLFTT